MNNILRNNYLSVSGIIEQKSFDVNSVKSYYPNWDKMTNNEKMSKIKKINPDDSQKVHNITTSNLHNYLVRNLDRDNNNPDSNISISWVGLGTGASMGTSVSDTDLNNRVYQQEVTDIIANGSEITSSTFIDSESANNETINEISLFTGNPENIQQDEVFMLNHATFNDIVKDNKKALTFDVTLVFGDNNG